MKKELTFVGFYSNREDMYTFPSAIAKMDYIIGSLNEMGINVNILSPCRLKRRGGYPVLCSSYKINDKTRLTNCFSFPYYSSIFKYIQFIISILWLFLYLLLHIGKEDTILLYHVVILDKIVMFVKSIKKFRVIIEVGEIFNDVEDVRMSKREEEISTIQKADGYLYSTILLDEVCNPLHIKPFTVALGSYKLTPIYDNIFNDNKIHIVYAGILRVDKGVDLAIKIAKYLDSNYCIHVLGYGTDSDIERITNEIQNINEKNSCEVIYEGLLSGDKYNQFIQSCHIGLCTQSTKVNYNATAFPSKVISYLSNGLSVIAVNIKSLEESEIKDLVCLYNNDSNQEIQIVNYVKGIKRTTELFNAIRGKIKELDSNYKNDLGIMFKNYIN